MGKKKGGKTQESYWDGEFENDIPPEEGSAPKEETPATAQPAPKGGKKGKKQQNNYWDGEFEEDAKTNAEAPQDAEEEEPVKTASKKKAQSNGTKATKTESKGDSATKSSNGAKKPGGNKKMVDLIRQQQEAQKQAAAEEEERLRQEEEEEREEEERMKAELAAERAAQKQKQLQQQQQAKAKVSEKDVKQARFLESLKERGLLPSAPTTDATPTATTKQDKKAKGRKNKAQTDAAPSVAPTEPVSTPEPTKPETPAVVPAATVQAETSAPADEDDGGNWEDWEDREIEIGKEAKPAASTEAKPQQTQIQKPTEQPDLKPAAKEVPKQEAPKKKEKPSKKGAKATEEEAPVAPEARELRSPICCILGHVDTGKTSLLDRIRHTNVQEGEAGGITQQIGATYFPMTTIQEQTAALSEQFNLIVKVPGLLIIDTPGHESFTNLRSRGSGLCDIAILVVDIMHGLEPQTIESINLLRMRKTPFVVALNKVDRIYGWKAIQNSPFRESLKHQTKNAAIEFDTRVKETIGLFAAQELNAVLYYRNKDFRNYVSLVPTSAHSGEGIPDLLMLLVQLTQKMMTERLYFSPEVQCTVLEVKVIEGHGTTIDVILVNGQLREGDTIVLSGMQGPIVTSVRALLTPQPLRELRVKGTYIHHKEIKAAMGIKIVAQDLEKAVAGSALLVADTEEDVDKLKKEVQRDFDSVLKSIDSSSRGVCVQASTLGSLEALLTFLKASKIPVSGVAIGPIHKRDVIRASVMLEHNPEFAVILAFDVKVEKEAQLFADEQGVRIFTADIIYHLFDKFTKYMDELKAKKREAASALAVWPCILKIKPECIFNKKDPIVLGVEVVEGTAKVGTPICVPSREFVEIGTITSIEHNHKIKQEAKKGDEVAIKIESTSADSKTFGRQFDETNELVSRISRESINALKELYGNDLSQADRQLIVKLKSVFKIQ